MLNVHLKLNVANTEFLYLFHTYIIWTYPRSPHLNKCSNSSSQKPRIQTWLLSFSLSQIQFISRFCSALWLWMQEHWTNHNPWFITHHQWSAHNRPHSYTHSSWQVNPSSNPGTRTSTMTYTYAPPSSLPFPSSSIPEVTLTWTVGLSLFGFLKNSFVISIHTHTQLFSFSFWTLWEKYHTVFWAFCFSTQSMFYSAAVLHVAAVRSLCPPRDSPLCERITLYPPVRWTCGSFPKHS